jgi:hypothetical protein
VEVELVMRRDGSKDLKDLQGMRFKKDGYTFKASQIRRGLSYAVILSKLNANEEKEQQRTINSQSRQIQTEQPRQETYSEQQKHNEPSIGIPSLGLFDTTNPVYDSAEEIKILVGINIDDIFRRHNKAMLMWVTQKSKFLEFVD